MSQDGYTHAETLAALVMIGLAIGGLTAGVRVIGLDQAATTRRLADGHGVAEAQRALATLFEGRGPFLSSEADGLRGDPGRLAFDCGAAGGCGASLNEGSGAALLNISGRNGGETIQMPGVPAARFLFVGSRTVGDRWPPVDPDPQTLRSIVIETGGAQPTPVAAVRLWREHPITCAFDPISQACRTVGP